MPLKYFLFWEDLIYWSKDTPNFGPGLVQTPAGVRSQNKSKFSVHTTNECRPRSETPTEMGRTHCSKRGATSRFRCQRPAQILFGVRASWLLPWEQQAQTAKRPTEDRACFLGDPVAKAPQHLKDDEESLVHQMQARPFWKHNSLVKYYSMVTKKGNTVSPLICFYLFICLENGRRSTPPHHRIKSQAMSEGE